MYDAIKKIIVSLLFVCITLLVSGQSLVQRLQSAYQEFEADSQLKNAIASLYVIDATGVIVFDKNSHVGLAPASTQKIITAASAYEMLGKGFSYQTQFGIERITNGSVLHIFPSGDPTLGSWRWKSTSEKEILGRLVKGIQNTKTSITDIVLHNDYHFSETIPDGWIWQDIGNYYGAGASAFNWRENQYDLILSSGNTTGQPVFIVGTQPRLWNYSIQSRTISAGKGSGDNAYIYFKPGAKEGIVRGTIPIEENRFVISGAFPSASKQFTSTLADTLVKLRLMRAMRIAEEDKTVSESLRRKMEFILIENSPLLDSLIFFFLKKSINLYGEALLKTIAKQNGFFTTDEGVEQIKKFWKERGITPEELNMVDGSGLSPLNRVTTHAQVNVLRYAKNKAWFKGYFDGFPEFNAMKMKSGTIHGVKGFCGYHKSMDGKEYIFSFLVNNYNGSASGVVRKMYRVLDVLK